MRSPLRYPLLALLLVSLLPLGCGSGGRGIAVALVDVRGKLRDKYGEPTGVGKLVTILGHATTQADENGEFFVPEVAVPYTIVLHDDDVAPGKASAIVIQGLTRPDPTYRPGWGSAPQPREAAVGGSAPPITEVPGDVLIMGSTARPHHARVESVSAASGSFVWSLRWGGPSTTTAILRALRFTRDADERPATFLGYGVSSTPLTSGLSLSGFSLPLTSVASRNIAGTMTVPFAVEDFTAVHQLRWSQWDRHELGRYAPAGPSFAFAVPHLPGLEHDLELTAWDLLKAFTRVHRINVQPGATNVQVVIPPPSHLLVPAEGAVFGPGTILQADVHPDRVHEFSVRPGLLQWDMSEPFPEGGKFTIYTTSPTTPIPDLAFLGVELAPDTPYLAYLTSFGPYPSIDAAFGQGGLYDTQRDGQFLTNQSVRQVQTAP